jgi:excisionase family DNA binding protein
MVDTIINKKETDSPSVYKQEIGRRSKQEVVTPEQTSQLNNSKGLLTVREVAKILNIHVNTVRRWSDDGILKPIRLGQRGDRRYKVNDIASFLADCSPTLKKSL